MMHDCAHPPLIHDAHDRDLRRRVRMAKAARAGRRVAGLCVPAGRLEEETCSLSRAGGSVARPDAADRRVECECGKGPRDAIRMR